MLILAHDPGTTRSKVAFVPSKGSCQHVILMYIAPHAPRRTGPSRTLMTDDKRFVARPATL